MSIRIDVGSVRAVIDSLKGVSEIIAGRTALDAGLQVLRGEVEANIGLTDHSLEDLRRLDHPYATRHGKIQIHSPKPWKVHSQSGAMLDSVESAVTGGSDGFRAHVWFNLAKAPHAQYVVQGTRVMLPRDVLWETANDTRVQKEIMKAIIRVLGQELRTRGKVRMTRIDQAKGATGL